MITREQVADLREGDVVELAASHWPEGTSWRGPLYGSGGELRIAGGLVRDHEGAPIWGDCWSLTVISRVPRLYVNHPRTEPVAGDVVRDADSDDADLVWHYYGGDWWTFAGNAVSPIVRDRHLRLLVDGETGMPVVPDLAEAWGDGFEAGSTWTSMNPGPAGGHTDPPLNPYETGQVVP